MSFRAMASAARSSSINTARASPSASPPPPGPAPHSPRPPRPRPPPPHELARDGGAGARADPRPQPRRRREEHGLEGTGQMLLAERGDRPPPQRAQPPVHRVADEDEERPPGRARTGRERVERPRIAAA